MQNSTIIFHHVQAERKYIGAYCDGMGITRVAVCNTQLPIDFSINAVGAHPDTISIVQSGVYKIKYTVNFEFMRYLVKGDTRKFIVDEYNRDEVVLRPVNEQTFVSFARKND